MLNRILALFLISSTAYADDGKFTLLAEEQPAPFEGVLFDPIATANIMTEKSNWQLQCDIEVEYNLDIANTEFDLERKNFNIRYEALDQEYKLIVEQKDVEIVKLQETIKKQSPPNKWAWFGVGSASGVIATVIIAKQFIE
jgi:hypothetical protein|tara:strand:+ start:1643 stop:2065 length:423 start_codon:yes stop_codon:yes gene_type:complete